MAKTRLEIVLSGQVQRFNDALREAQRVGAEALTAIGAEAKKASEALEETGEAAEQAGDGLEEAAKSSKRTGDDLGETAKSSKRASDSLKETGESARKAGSDLGEISQAAQIAGAALGGVAIAGAAITKSFISEANQMQKYEATLKALTGSTEEARTELEKYLKFAADAPAFDLKGVMDGALKMKALKVDVERFLPLAGDLAAVFDRSLPDAALALAKALSGSQDGLTQLADAFGVTKKELIQFGAATKGDVIDVKQIDKLQAAIEKVVSQKYGGVMMEQAQMANGAFATLEDAISRLKAAFGKEIIDEFASLAKALTGVIEHIERWPDATKEMIAKAVVAGTVMATLGAAAIGAKAALVPLMGVIRGFSALNASTAFFKGLDVAISGSVQAALTGAPAMGKAAGATTLAGRAASGAATAFRTLAGTLGLGGGLIAVSAALAGGVIALTAAYDLANAAAEKTQIAQQKVADRFRESRTTIVELTNALKEHRGEVEQASASAATKLKDAGKDDLDAARAILALTEQRNEAYTRLADAQEKVSKLRKPGADPHGIYAKEAAAAEASVARQKELIDDLSQKIAVAYGAREELSGTHVAKVEAEKKAEQDKAAAIEAAAKALEDYNQKASAGFFASKAQQLAALDLLLAGMKQSDAEYQKLALSRVKLAREVGEEEAKAAEETRKKNVDAAMWELDKLKALGNDNYQQRRAALEKILAETNLNTEERKKLELELLQVEKTIGDNKVAIAKKTADAKLKAESAAAKLRVDSAKTDRGEADQEVDILKERLDLGEDVLGQLKQQLQVRQDMLEVEIKAAAEADKVGKSAAERAMIDKQAESAITMSRKDTARETEALDRKNTERRKKSALEALKLEQELVKARAEADGKVTKSSILKVAQERLRLAEEELRLEAEIASVGASDEEKKRINLKLELDLWKLRKQSTEELAAANDELDKAKKKAEALKGTFKTGYGVDQLVKDMASLGDIRRRGAQDSSEDDGVTDADRRRAGGALGVDPNERPPEAGEKTSSGASSPAGFGTSKWERERQAEAAKKESEMGKGGGGAQADGLTAEGLAKLTNAVERFHADVLAAASRGGVKVEIVPPPAGGGGGGNSGWTYRSTRIGE